MTQSRIVDGAVSSCRIFTRWFFVSLLLIVVMYSNMMKATAFSKDFMNNNMHRLSDKSVIRKLRRPHALSGSITDNFYTSAYTTGRKFPLSIKTVENSFFVTSCLRSYHLQGKLHVSSQYADAPVDVSFDDEVLNGFNVEGVPVLRDEHDKDISTLLESKGIASRPKDGGNWNVLEPLKWAKNFGRRSHSYEETILNNLIRLKPGDEGYFDVSEMKVPNVTIVRTKEQALIVLQKLMNHKTGVIHACDTEVMNIDLKSVGPVGNGYVTCVSIYSGPDFDYGLGDGPGTSLWIDNLDDSCGLLQEFKDWFEDDRHLKVWHNYGFDRHVMWNEGIDVRGFGGDTMHMARLLDSSRGRGYSLESLTTDYLNRPKVPMKTLFGVARLRKDGTAGSLVDIPPVEVLQRDPTYRSDWIKYSCYDAEGTWLLREELEKNLMKLIWFQDDSLFKYYWDYMRPFGEVLTDMERRGVRVDAGEYLAGVEVQARKDREHHLNTFHRWAATKIGADGWALNVASSLQMRIFLFGGAENSKTKIPTENEYLFKVPREEISEEAIEAYRQQNLKLEEASPKDASEEVDDPLQYLETMKVAKLKEICKEQGLKLSGSKTELQERIRQALSSAEQTVNDNNSDVKESDLETKTKQELLALAKSRGIPMHGKEKKKELIDLLRSDQEMTRELAALASKAGQEGLLSIDRTHEVFTIKDGGVLAAYIADSKNKAKEESKYIDVTVKSLGLKPEKFTAGGMPSVTSDVLRMLAGDPFADPPRYGTAKETIGEDGCKALFSLCAIGSIDTMITNFLSSLQELVDDQSRVHCSLNLNTETGRLSSRRPNLQNQPALEKDKYKIRKSFQSSPGNTLIVADYGQLELRLLASLTKCTSMIEAFAAGGDFHSRTAIDMFDYVRKAVDSGECLLEWDYSQGKPPKPLLKDMFASERRKAKTLNFSIAYGKTSYGLSKDWGVTKDEAQKMLNAWYDARKEVREWQEATRETAKEKGWTRTLMHRYRMLPGAMLKNDVRDDDRRRNYQRFQRSQQSYGDERNDEDQQDRDNRFSIEKIVSHCLRASINTPIQGGAADIAMMAMIKINNSQKLKDLGWILLLQIHDEVMLEGPEETAEEAFAEVLKCMEEPWVFGLEKTSVPLTVDGSWHHNNWFEAK